MRLVYVVAIGMAACIFTSCEKNPVIPNEEELITTLEIHLHSIDGGADASLIFNDPDGDGGLAPVLQTDSLQAHHHYEGSVILTNNAVSPPADITEEIAEESNDHQFFFGVDNLELIIEYADVDLSGRPVGLDIDIETSSAGQGFLTVTLRHLPDKDAPGVVDGIIENAGGETDIEVVFPVVIRN